MKVAYRSAAAGLNLSRKFMVRMPSMDDTRPAMASIRG